MKVYTFTAEGVTLGSDIVVVAGNNVTAEKLARKWLVERALDPESLELVQAEELSTPMVVFGFDGDY